MLAITFLSIAKAATVVIVLFLILVILACRIIFRIKRLKCKNTIADGNLRDCNGQKAAEKSDEITNSNGCTTIAFFHPHCASGGGGERVLWSAILVLAIIDQKRQLQRLPRLKVVIYTVDLPVAQSASTTKTTEDNTPNYHEFVLQKVQSRFKIKVPTTLDLSFIPIGPDNASSGPTSLWKQSLKSMALSWRALNAFCPDIYFDTTGHAFTFVVARLLGGCRVAAYVHYPTISTDMLAMVWERRPSYNNDSAISNSPLKTTLKMAYYFIFSILYGFVGSLSQLTMVNSTWTYGHISKLWRLCRNITVIYPPCDTSEWERISLARPREPVILSIGQFRPEKDHILQLRSFAKFQRKVKDASLEKMMDAKLVLLGGCRNEEDRRLVNHLRTLASELQISDRVAFVINQPFPVLKDWLTKSSVGLHTMWNEHFGIGVVECMSAGCVTIAHKSGGPLMDIVKPSQLDVENFAPEDNAGVRRDDSSSSSATFSGYLACTEEEYASIMYEIFYELSIRQIANIRENARKSASRFSQQVFDDSFEKALLSSGLLR